MAAGLVTSARIPTDAVRRHCTAEMSVSVTQIPDAGGGWRCPLDAAADSSELQRQTQQPGRDEHRAAHRAKDKAAQLKNHGNEEQDGSDDGQHGDLLGRSLVDNQTADCGDITPRTPHRHDPPRTISQQSTNRLNTKAIRTTTQQRGVPTGTIVSRGSLDARSQLHRSPAGTHFDNVIGASMRPSGMCSLGHAKPVHSPRSFQPASLLDSRELVFDVPGLTHQPILQGKVPPWFRLSFENIIKVELPPLPMIHECHQRRYPAAQPKLSPLNALEGLFVMLDAGGDHHLPGIAAPNNRHSSKNTSAVNRLTKLIVELNQIARPIPSS